MMSNKRIFYRGEATFSHYCDAGWRGHISSVVVEQISPRMGVIVDSDGGGTYSGSKRQRYWPQAAANQEVGKKVQLSRVIAKADEAAELWEARDKVQRKRPLSTEHLLAIYNAISRHPSFAGFKDITC